MANGRKKAHHTHEINDAYAEGWDARTQWRLGRPLPVNPYKPKIIPHVLGMPRKKQSVGKRTTRQRDEDQWQQGWDACHKDIFRGDLEEVQPADFRPVDVEKLLAPKPDVEEALGFDLD